MKNGLEPAKLVRRRMYESRAQKDQAEDPKADAMRSQFERLLEEGNVFSLTHHPKTGAEMIVVNEAALKAAIDGLFSKARSQGGKTSKEKLFEILPAVVGNSPVLTADQVSRSDFLAKPLFYIPETPDAATDTVAIKKSKFHHLVSDFVPYVRGERPAYPTRNKSADTVDTFETKIAVLIFHPDYGDGFRDEKGTLFVRDRATRDYGRLSGDFFKKHGVRYAEFKKSQGKVGVESPQSFREGVSAELPHLVAKGLIRPVQDFKQLTYGPSEVANQRVERAGVSPSGSRMIRGVVHYIGREFVGKPVRIVEISPTIGAVVDMSRGFEKVTHTFNIVSREQAKREQAKVAKSNMFLAGAPLTQPTPFSAETVALPRGPSEALEHYHDRVEKTDRGLAFLLLHVFPKYPDLAKVLRDRPTYEQTSIAQAAYLLERDKQAGRFDEFVNEYGEPGARTFLVTANDETLREQVFDFAKHVSLEDAEKVFTH